MIVLDKGNKYKSEGSQGFSLDMTFTHRDSKGNFVKGLTNEDVLLILIDRLAHQNKVSRDGDTFNAVLHLQQAKQFLDLRNDKKLKSRHLTSLSKTATEVAKNDSKNETDNTGDGLPVQDGE
jgi:hypothetical protein